MESEFSKWAKQLEKLAQEGVKKEIALHKAQGHPIFYSREGTPIMELPDVRCFEYVQENGKRKIIREVTRIAPDNEARKIRPDNPEAARSARMPEQVPASPTLAIQGGKSAIKRARTYLANNESFAAETTLSGNTEDADDDRSKT